MNCTKRWTLLAAGLLLGALLVQPAEAGRWRRGGCGGGSCGRSAGCGWSGGGCGWRGNSCYTGNCSTGSACTTGACPKTDGCSSGACSTGAACSACTAGVPHQHDKVAPAYDENHQPSASNAQRAPRSTRATATTRIVRPSGPRG